MRAAFSIVGLLAALLIVMWLAKRQVAVLAPTGAASAAAPAAQAQRAAQEVQRAMERAAAERASEADR